MKYWKCPNCATTRKTEDNIIFKPCHVCIDVAMKPIKENYEIYTEVETKETEKEIK